MEITAIIGLVTFIALLVIGLAFRSLRETVGIIAIGAGVVFALTTMGAIFAIPMLLLGGALLWVEFRRKRGDRERQPA